MRVLFLGPLPDPVTGHSLACQVFYDELVKHCDVELVNLRKSEFKQGINSVRRVMEVLAMLWRIWRRRNRCDTIYLTVSQSVGGNLKDLVIYLICFARLSRMAIHLHGGAGMRRIMSGEYPVLRRLNRFFVQRLGAVIVLGQRHLDIYASAIPTDRIHTVPNFAQDYLFTDRDSIVRKFERVAAIRILFLSNLLPGKGHVEIVNAFGELGERSRNALAIDFAGDFETESQRAAFLKSIESYPQLQYHGIVHGEKKKQLFLQAHVFCLPTYYPYEGQPISILEAYASGCAVITTDHSGVFDIFVDGVNGIAVAKQSIQTLTAAFELAIAFPQDLRRMALANHDAALERYRPAQYTRALVAIMEKLHAQVT